MSHYRIVTVSYYSQDHLYSIIFNINEQLTFLAAMSLFKKILFSEWLETKNGKAFRRRVNFLKTIQDNLTYDDFDMLSSMKTFRKLLSNNGILYFYVKKEYCNEYYFFDKGELSV